MTTLETGGLNRVFDSFDQAIETLLMTLEARDLELHRHAHRVAQYAVQIAVRLGLDARLREQIHYGALLHDIGHIGIPDGILHKPTALTAQEWEEVKLHTVIGEHICRALPCAAPFLPLIRSHHERLDGTGYPDGLRGPAIPVAVRILAVADVYDSLRSHRVHRAGLGHQDALAILRREAAHGWWDAASVEQMAALNLPDSDFRPLMTTYDAQSGRFLPVTELWDDTLLGQASQQAA